MGKDQPRASIVVAVYNAEDTLESCIRSLLKLEYPAERELLFVDNASTDGSSRILERFRGEIRILREPKRGASAARNHGIREARFPLVAFTDSDCTTDPYWLHHLVAPLAVREVGVSGGRILSRRPCNRVEAFGETVHDNANAIGLYRPPYVASGNWASRREVLESLNYFDERFLRSQDAELSCRMLQAGFKLVYAPEAIVYHRNESTYFGLFKEGFTHGMHGVAVLERHLAFYKSFGYRRGSLKRYRQLGRNLRDYWIGTERDTAGCHLVFNTGKRLGRLAGSIRHGSLHL